MALTAGSSVHQIEGAKSGGGGWGQGVGVSPVPGYWEGLHYILLSPAASLFVALDVERIVI